MDASTPIVDAELFQNDFMISAGTTKGKTYRDCPVCKKKQKVERLGEHVHKHHPDFWTALFSIESLQKAIDDKALVPCTVAEADHDQKFLVCLACDSVRTTDRNHFQKNGEIHLNTHLETATKMIATRRGVKYVPKKQTDIEALLTQLDKYKRQAKMCEHEHADVGAAICDRDDAIQENIQLKATVARLNRGTMSLESIIALKDKQLADINIALKTVACNLHPGTVIQEKDVLALGHIMGAVSKTILAGR